MRKTVRGKRSKIVGILNDASNLTEEDFSKCLKGLFNCKDQDLSNGNKININKLK